MSQDRIRELEQIIEQQNRNYNELYARTKKAEDMVQILEKIIKHQNRQGAIGEAVAVTADGKVYVGAAMPHNRITNRYLETPLRWVGKADYFFFNRVLRLPYLLDWVRKVMATRRLRK